MNSEAETVGKQAVLAWKVDRGSFNGKWSDPNKRSAFIGTFAY